MGKNAKQKRKNKQKSYIIDMAYRKNMNVNLEKTYSDEEMHLLIIELQKQMKQMQEMEQRYYSVNAYIERIEDRNFIDIFREKVASLFGKNGFEVIHKKGARGY